LRVDARGIIGTLVWKILWIIVSCFGEDHMLAVKITSNELRLGPERFLDVPQIAFGVIQYGAVYSRLPRQPQAADRVLP
jgi:hypothetical protein